MNNKKVHCFQHLDRKQFFLKFSNFYATEKNHY